MVVINITAITSEGKSDPYSYHVRSYTGDYSYDARQQMLSIKIDAQNVLHFMHPVMQSFDNGKLTFAGIEKTAQFNTARLIVIEST